MGEEWSASDEPRLRHLGLLSLAASEVRGERFPQAIVLLDSVLLVVPTKELGIRSIARVLLSNALTMLGDPAQGLITAEDGLKALPDTGFVRERLRLMIVQAEATLMGEHSLDEAFNAFMETARLAEKSGSALSWSSAENGMGLVRLNQARYDEAWRHFEAGLSHAQAANSEMAMQNMVANLSLTAAMSGKYDLALRLCDSLLTVLGDRSPDLRISLLDTKSVIYRRTGRNEQALAELHRALALRDTANETYYTAKLPQSEAILFWAMGRRKEAFHSIEDALRVAERLDWVAQQAELHQELYDWYSEIGNAEKALAHLEVHTRLSDTLDLERYNAELANAEALYGKEKRDRRIAEQDQALELATAESSRKSMQRNALIGATLAFALIALLLYRTIRNRQRLAKKEKELHHEQVDQLLGQQEMKSINAMLEGQEQERERVSKELHDHVGHLLGTIKHQLGALQEQVADVRSEQSVQYRKVTDLLDNAAGELRRISHDMAAATLNRFGLEKALQDLRDTLQVRGRLRVELSLFGLEDKLERSVEIAVYRIIQELVSNVLKHSGASELTLDVTRAPGHLSVMVGDNGKGFDTSRVEYGVGLANVRDRTAALGGKARIDSMPGKGTIVSVECPVVE